MARAGRILVVDDDANARTVVADRLRDEDFEVETAANAAEAVDLYAAFAPHLVVTDLEMPGTTGIELVKTIRAAEDPAAVIVMTAVGDKPTAVAAMREGAAEHLSTPVDLDELLVVVDNALANLVLQREVRQLRSRVRDRFAPDHLVGSSPAMQRVFEIVDQVAPTRATVLITGESGTGKELVANALHQRSPRASGPFIKVHCAGLAESLLDSELFGHEQGAFSGAVARKDGKCSLADGGTLFLDDIGEITPAIQIKLLRLLQDHELERVGGTQTLVVDVRVIAATNADLKAQIARGRFREDLFYRLNVVSLELPALRDRASDIPSLAAFFVDRYAHDYAKTLETISPAALELLVRYDWPGNVRELENAIQRAALLAKGPTIEARHLPPNVRPTLVSDVPAVPGATMAELERYAILATLRATGGSTSKAAEILCISPRTIQYRLHDYHIAPRSGVEVRRAKSAQLAGSRNAKP